MLRAPTAFVVSASLLLNIACGARTPAVLPPGELPSRIFVRLDSSTPFDFVGQTAADVSLRCPAVSLTGQLGKTRGDTLNFVRVYEHVFLPTAPPGCGELMHGLVVPDSSQPITITRSERPQPKVWEALVYLGGAVAILAVLYLKLRCFLEGNEECPV